MNQRFQATLANDPDLKITISLTNVLIFKVFYLPVYYKSIIFDSFKDPSITQWTNTTYCGVPNNPNFNGKIPILSNCSLSTFGNYMKSIESYLKFSYDHAVAIVPPTYLIFSLTELFRNLF